MSETHTTTPPDDDLKDLHSPAQIAEEYPQLSVYVLVRMRMKGDGPLYYKFNRQIYYNKLDVEAWMRSTKRHSTSG